LANTSLLNLDGAAAAYAVRLRLGPAPGDAPPLDAAALTTADGVARAMEGLMARHAGRDRRAVASLWTKHYVAAVLSAPLAALAWTGAGPLAPAAASQIDVGADGLPTALRLPSVRLAEGETALAALFGDHLALVFAAVGGVAGLSLRVMWSNAGNLAAHLLDCLEQAPAAPATVAPLRRALLEPQHVSWAGGTNPLRTPVTWLTLAESGLPPRIHRRRVCCLRHRLGMTECYSCPRLSEAERKSVLRQRAS